MSGCVGRQDKSYSECYNEIYEQGKADATKELKATVAQEIDNRTADIKLEGFNNGYTQGKADGAREMFEKFCCHCEYYHWQDIAGHIMKRCTKIDNLATFDNCPIAKGGK